ncbi:MAG: hypothetical protein ACRC6I_11260 [Paracoccaceae bacterium]
MDIISKKSGPRAEDQQAKQHLQRNWGTIEKLADTLSGGKYSANKARKTAQPPQAKGLIFVDQAPPRLSDAPVPYLRISANGRVVIADTNSGVQMHFLGQLKRINGEVRFILATKENGFITPLDPDLLEKITDLAEVTVNRSYSEENLAEDIKMRLQIS